MKAESGTEQSAAPRVRTEFGTPAQVLDPRMLAARIVATASDAAVAPLPKIWLTNSSQVVRRRIPASSALVADGSRGVEGAGERTAIGELYSRPRGGRGMDCARSPK